MIDEVSRVLFRFANSFDSKDWPALQDTLADFVECDYQDLRGKSEHMSNHAYVSLREKALDHLKTQHIFSNLEVSIKKASTECRLSAIIFRQNNKGIQFNTHAIYHFYLIQNKNEEWKISKIKQSVLWNEGDPSIHKGVVN